MLTKYELERHELLLLREACRTVHQLDALFALTEAEGLVVEGPHGSKPHPAFTAAQSAKITFARILAALRIPTDEAAAGRSQRRQVRGVYSLPGAGA